MNVFKYMQKALSQYATGDDGQDFPAKDIDRLLELIDQTIGETDDFLKTLSVDLEAIIAGDDTFDKMEELRKAFNIIIANDDDKEKFKVLSNTLMNLHDASKPEVFELGWHNEKFAPIAYLHGLLYNQIDDEKIKRARLRMGQVLDNALSLKRQKTMTRICYSWNESDRFVQN